jgi:hypothetical protein
LEFGEQLLQILNSFFAFFAKDVQFSNLSLFIDCLRRNISSLDILVVAKKNLFGRFNLGVLELIV